MKLLSFARLGKTGFGAVVKDGIIDLTGKLDPEIIACSETQERFCVVVPEDHAQAICDIFNS